jgi:hypothetical protein
VRRDQHGRWYTYRPDGTEIVAAEENAEQVVSFAAGRVVVGWLVGLGLDLTEVLVLRV